tara:strand:- start:250 stop:504 length:255 start_codon:yes stop_codon:yes gene_type:complete
MRRDPEKGILALPLEDLGLLNPVELMGFFLWVAVVAYHQEDKETLLEALGHVEWSARGLTEKEVLRGKMIAFDMYEHHGVDSLD